MAAVLRIAVVAVVLAGVAASPPRPREQSWGQPLAANKSVPVPKLRDVSVDASTPALIAKYGYESETHTIKTSDGYLLTLHRIPNPGKPVVYLQHGLLCSSADWVVLGPEESLAYILYDAGYDVWMGNTRGNTYSRAHATLTPEDDAFWDFSWHEMGIYDIPEMIDFILAKTELDSLVYIGHSQGTTAFFVMASLLPEYNDKVKAFIALAPVAYVHSVASLPLQFIAKNIATFGFVTNLFGMNEFLPSSSFLAPFESLLCADGSILQSVCTNSLFLISGYDPEGLDTEKLPDIVKNAPAGASTKQIVHYGQLINNDEFRQYDLGLVNNMITYKSVNPPDYPLEKISTKVYLHYADNDLLATPTGVKKLIKRLTSVKLIRKVPNDKYNHMDFQYARNSRSLVYDQVMETIAEVNKA